jgi:hypothetical protein
MTNFQALMTNEFVDYLRLIFSIARSERRRAAALQDASRFQMFYWEP